MDVKIILKKIAEINNKANKDHTHDDLIKEIDTLKQQVASLQAEMNKMLYFEEIETKK